MNGRLLAQKISILSHDDVVDFMWPDIIENGKRIYLLEGQGRREDGRGVVGIDQLVGVGSHLDVDCLHQVQRS